MRWPWRGGELGGAPAMLRRRKAKYGRALLPPATQSSAQASGCVSRALRKMEQVGARWWQCSARRGERRCYGETKRGEGEDGAKEGKRESFRASCRPLALEHEHRSTCSHPRVIEPLRAVNHGVQFSKLLKLRTDETFVSETAMHDGAKQVLEISQTNLN
jgi:hypothetical protein